MLRVWACCNRRSPLHHGKPSRRGGCAAGDPEAYPIVGLEYFMMDQDLSTLGTTLSSAPPT